MTEEQKSESIPEKIYSDDELLRYKDTDISPSRRKALIDGVLAEYGVQDVGWRWNKDGIDRNEQCEIFVIFKIDDAARATAALSKEGVTILTEERLRAL